MLGYESQKVTLMSISAVEHGGNAEAMTKIGYHRRLLILGSEVIIGWSRLLALLCRRNYIPIMVVISALLARLSFPLALLLRLAGCSTGRFLIRSQELGFNVLLLFVHFFSHWGGRFFFFKFSIGFAYENTHVESYCFVSVLLLSKRLYDL